jgi:hypothetical protein
MPKQPPTTNDTSSPPARSAKRLLFTSADEALAYVNRVGFCLLFPTDKIALPDLWQFGEGSEAWYWKDDLTARKAAFYSRVIANRASLVALDILPALYSISVTADYGGDRFEIYRAGKIRADTNRLVGVLSAKGPLTTRALGRETGMKGYRFKRALDEAQAMFLAVRADTTGHSIGTYTYIWDSFQKVWPEMTESGLRLQYEEALLQVITRYLRVAVAAEPAKIGTIFNMEAEHCSKMVDWMLQQGLLKPLKAGERELVGLADTVDRLYAT